jgi:glycosyltransferase involved in cell wall biosynthesis
MKEKVVFFLLFKIEGAGVVSHCLDLANELKSDGYRAIFIHAGEDSKHRGEKWIRQQGFEVTSINFKRKPLFLAFLNIRSMFRYLKLVYSLRPDIIHCHYRSMAVFALVSKILFKTKTILTVHLANTKETRSYKYFLRRFDKIIAISTEIEDELKQQGIPNQRITKIFNGTDSERFRPLDRKSKEFLRLKHELDPQKLTILTVARLEKVKGIEVLLKALIELATGFREKIQCVIVGDGPEMEKLSNLVNDNGLETMVKFTGYKKPDEFYALSDVFILPSRNEGFSVAVIEAMLSGLAIIMTQVSGSFDQIIHGQNGYTFSVNDHKLLKLYIENVSLFPSLLQKMQQQSYLLATANFTSKIMGNKTCNVYDELLVNEKVQEISIVN